MFSTKMMIFSCLIATFIAFSTATVPCCDFENSTCSWDTVSWNTAPDTVPDNTSYPGFLPPDASYRWLQDKSGTLSTTANYSIDAAGEVISMDYYFYSPNYITGDYLNVVFRNAQTKRTNRIARITSSKDAWKHYEITCDFRVNYCCGSLAAVPCSGTFEITANLNLPTTKGLFGLDNFGECSSTTTTTTTTTGPSPTSNPDTTTTTSYTLPPPVQRDCCRFESDVCGFTASDWYWSSTKPSPYPIEDYSSNYLWTDVNGAIATTLPLTDIYTDTTFSVTYYINSSLATIRVTFQETGVDNPKILDTLITENPGTWQHHFYYVPSPCTTSIPCSGSISLQAILPDRSDVVAIDDVDRDGKCLGSFPCCYFDDPFLCDLKANDSFWKWSGDPNNVPRLDIPSPGSQFVYIEYPYANFDFDAYVPLRSGVITISADTVFVGNFFAYRTKSQSPVAEPLELNFIYFNTNTKITMDYVAETYGNWLQITFYCKSSHGDCCQNSGSTCLGTLEFMAHIEPNVDDVIYAIDAISVDGKCSPFPGITMTSGSGNSSFIQLHP